MKKNYWLVLILVFVGCAAPTFHPLGSLNTHGSRLEPGKVLVMPTRNVLQAGVPHPAGYESGSVFQSTMINQLNSMNGFSAISSNDSVFNHSEIPNLDSAVAEGVKLNTDYVLITVLGEFRDAAAMTFRPDFVRLEEARMYSVSTGKEVWGLSTRYELSGPNTGNYLDFVQKLAVELAIDIAQ